MFKVYILYAESHDKIYIGFTGNLEERLIAHNHLASKGWTIQFRPWTLIYTEDFETNPEAVFREKQLKTAKGRNWIRTELILNDNWACIRRLADGFRTLPSQPTKVSFDRDFFILCSRSNILYAETCDKIYIGFTGNLEERLIAHNHLASKGWTIQFRLWSLLYTEDFETKAEAMLRERQLKTAKGRKWICTQLVPKR